MEKYQKLFARTLAETGALFFERDLVLKDGRPTPYFVNMAMFKTGRLSLELGSFYAGMMVAEGLVERTDIVIGPSYKGSSLALATVIALWKDHGKDLLFDYDRKEAKNHGEGSVAKSAFVNRTLFDRCRIFVIDDVATSMGTKDELLEKIANEAEHRSITVDMVGIGIGVDREQTTALYDEESHVVLNQKGANAIQGFTSRTGVPVYRIAGIREVVAYLYLEKIPVLHRGKHEPLDEGTKVEFDKYLATYGVD
jgi:orotate phosphoribosyltransferase